MNTDVCCNRVSVSMTAPRKVTESVISSSAHAWRATPSRLPAPATTSCHPWRARPLLAQARIAISTAPFLEALRGGEPYADRRAAGRGATPLCTRTDGSPMRLATNLLIAICSASACRITSPAGRTSLF